METMNNTQNLDYVNQVTNNDIEVSTILLDMPFLFTNDCSTSRFPYYWTRKKRRTALDHPPPPVAPPVAAVKPPPSATSPDNPLAFPASDSDGKSTPSPSRLIVNKEKDKDKCNKTSVKLTIEKLKEKIKQKEQVRMTFQTEIEKINQHYEKLKAENMELKAQKNKLIIEQEGEILGNTNTQLLDDDHLHASPSTSTQDQQQTPLIPDQLHESPPGHVHVHHRGPLISHPDRLMVMHYPYQPFIQMGPHGFDLNVSEEEMAARRRAQARGARVNRKQMIKDKRTMLRGK